MTDRLAHLPPDRHAVTPRIVAVDARGLVAFVAAVFGARGEYVANRPTDVKIGDSIIMISDAGPRDAATALLYVYVEDVDATFRRALEAGAQALETPAVMPWGDRRGIVRDAWGNTWQIATYNGHRAA